MIWNTMTKAFCPKAGTEVWQNGTKAGKTASGTTTFRCTKCGEKHL